MPRDGFTHLDSAGRARMVDITEKSVTKRQAIARGRVLLSASTAAAVAAGEVAKGDVLAVARVAGVQAAKRCWELVPLCHPLLLGAVSVDLEVLDESIEIEARVESVGRTGVEMEALTACSVAALTVYDMCKAKDRSMVISDVCLWEKSGGRSGKYRRENLH